MTDESKEMKAAAKILALIAIAVMSGFVAIDTACYLFIKYHNWLWHN